MKKSIIYSICAVVVLAALVASVVFVFSGKGKAPQTEKLDLTGTWVVAAVYDNDTPVFTEKQFMVFADDSAAMYKDENSEPYASSGYTINETNQLILSDISREYKVAKKTDNCVRLYESTTKYILLIRNSSSDLAVAPVKAADFAGKWNIIMKGDQFNNGEALEFADNSLNYYKSASEKPFANTTFSLSEDGILTAENMGLTMRCYPTSNNAFILIEQNGIAWEISK